MPAAGAAGTSALGAGAAGVLFLVAWLQPWYRTPAGFEPYVAQRGVDQFLFGVVPLVLLLSAAVVVAGVLPALGPATTPAAAAVSAAIGAALVVLRLALPVEAPPPDRSGFVPILETGPWLYVAAVSAVAVAVSAAYALAGAIASTRTDDDRSDP